MKYFKGDSYIQKFPGSMIFLQSSWSPPHYLCVKQNRRGEVATKQLLITFRFYLGDVEQQITYTLAIESSNILLGTKEK